MHIDDGRTAQDTAGPVRCRAARLGRADEGRPFTERTVQDLKTARLKMFAETRIHSAGALKGKILWRGWQDNDQPQIGCIVPAPGNIAGQMQIAQKLGFKIDEPGRAPNALQRSVGDFTDLRFGPDPQRAKPGPRRNIRASAGASRR